MIRIIFFYIVFFILSIDAGIAGEVEKFLQKQEKTIYFVSSYNDNNEWTRRVRGEMSQQLRNSGFLLNMRNIYLESNSLMGESTRKRVIQSYLDGVNEIIDVFVATDYGAVKTMLSFSPAERAHIPLVCVSEYDLNKHIDSTYLCTGGIAEIPFEKTFDFARKSLPEAKKAYIWIDKTQRGKFYMQEAKRQLAKYEGDIEIEYGIDALSASQFLNKAASLPRNSFVIFGDWYQDDTHHYHNPEYFYPMLSKTANVPVFSVVDNYMRSGFAGGYVLSPKSLGVMAARKTLAILNGTPVNEVKIENISPLSVFNQTVFNQKGIPLSNIPNSARLINLEKSFLKQYKTQKKFIQTVCIILCFISLLMGVLYRHRQRRLRASLFRERILKQTKEKLKFRSELLSDTISSLNEAMVTIGADLSILECNDRFCKMIDMTHEEITGKSLMSICEFANLGNIEEFLSEVYDGSVSGKNIPPMFLISRNGVSHYVDGEALSFAGNSSEYSGVILLLRDVLAEMRRQKMRSVSLNALKAYTWFYDKSTDELLFGEGIEKLNVDTGQINTLEKFGQYLHPLDRERLREFLAGNFEPVAKGEFSITYRVDFAGNGEYKWFECRGVMENSKIGDQTISYLYGIQLDIDELKNHEARVALNQQLFTMVGDAAKVGYAKYNLKTGKGFALPQWFKNMDLSPENREDFDFRETFNYVASDQRYDLLKFYVKAICKQETSYCCDKKIITPEGNIKWLHGNMLVCENSEKELELIEITYDITEQKKVEKDLIIAKNKAESANQLKSAFLANMSHEIRTPLNAIVGFCDLLMSSESTQEEREMYGKVILSNNELLLKLINDILDLSKIEAGFMEFNYSQFELNAFFNDMKVLNESLMPSGVELKLECEKPEYFVSLDRDKTSQVINNLVSNAIKFTKAGSITLGYRIVNHELIIFVSDTGIGILPENCVKVFDRFEKLNTFSPGTGLGLSICKAIIEAAGGHIYVDSVYGEGTTFNISVPIEYFDSKYSGEAAQEGCENERNHIKRDLSACKILVAEDIDSNYMLVENILKDYRLDRAHDGDEVIEKIQRENYDLILMDIKMPGINGLEAAQIIREFNDRIPIVAVTAYAFDTDRKKILESGCDMFISKPFNRQELLSTVYEAITMDRVLLVESKTESMLVS